MTAILDLEQYALPVRAGTPGARVIVRRDDRDPVAGPLLEPVRAIDA